MSRELLQMALDALETLCAEPNDTRPRTNPFTTITALRSALAAPQPEPVTVLPDSPAAVEYIAERLAFNSNVRWRDLSNSERNAWRDIARKDRNERLARVAPPAAPAPAVPDQLIEALRQQSRDQYRNRPDDQVPPAFLHWLDTQARREGVGANEAWNAGVAWKAAQSAAPAVREPQDERAAFEAWWAAQGNSVSRYPKDPDTYTTRSADFAWQAWQARAAYGIGGGGK